MEKTDESMIFLCPGCRETFEFDPEGEYELVLCPMCGTEFMTIKKDQTMLLEFFESNPIESSPAILR